VVHRSAERSQVIATLTEAGGPLLMGEIMAQTGLKRNAADLLLGRMAKEREIVRVGRGRRRRRRLPAIMPPGVVRLLREPGLRQSLASSLAALLAAFRGRGCGPRSIGPCKRSRSSIDQGGDGARCSRTSAVMTLLLTKVTSI
jgi:hypothetical protein